MSDSKHCLSDTSSSYQGGRKHLPSSESNANQPPFLHCLPPGIGGVHQIPRGVRGKKRDKAIVRLWQGFRVSLNKPQQGN